MILRTLILAAVICRGTTGLRGSKGRQKIGEPPAPYDEEEVHHHDEEIDLHFRQEEIRTIIEEKLLEQRDAKPSLFSEIWFDQKQETFPYVQEAVESHRSLQQSQFAPLNCNVQANLEYQTCTTLWSDYVGAGSTRAQEVVINCGDCVLFDYSGSETLTLSGGLDVQGKLVMPEGTKVRIDTPYVRVQGYLEMTSTKPVNGEEDIRFVLTGTSTSLATFTPADTNAVLGTQEMGKKPFVVAGGKATINGLPPATPSWVPVHDVVTADTGPALDEAQFRSFVPPPPGCDGTGMLVNEDFASAASVDSSGVFAALGSEIEYSTTAPGDGNATVVIVKDRTSDRHGLEFDLKRIRSCLKSNDTHLLTASVRLNKAGTSAGSLTDCATVGDGCLKVKYEYMRADRKVYADDKYAEKQSFQFKYGEWLTISSQFTFADNEIKGDNIYQTLRFEGPLAAVVMEIDKVVLQTPPKDAFRQAPGTCQDLIPANGQADLNNPFPFYPNLNVINVAVKEEDNNRYFAVSGRKYAYYHADYSKDYHWSSIAVDFPVACGIKGSRYRFGMKVRVHPNAEYQNPEGVLVYIKGYHNDPDKARTYTLVTQCPQSLGDWVECNGDFEFPEEMTSGDPYQYTLYFQTKGGNTVDYDIDDVSFTMSSGPLYRIVVGSQVKGKWEVGAEVLLTSNTLDYKDQQLRKIASISDHTDSDFVVIALDDVINPPSTLLENPAFGSEFALMSRNIVFEGDNDDSVSTDGAHFVFHKTPQVAQTLEGVEFRNFGQRGRLGRYPIHMHMCGDVPGSRISKNLIRDSNQRCVVLQGTNYADVSSNVAYSSVGHCFMTEDGGEHDNVFSDNLGALTKNMPKPGLIQGYGDQTDNNAATFYITSPSNRFVGNVAAGSESEGFWTYFASSVRGLSKAVSPSFNPKKEKLMQFDGNIAHSNNDNGIRVRDFVPSARSVFRNTRSYRNRDDGVYVTGSRNITFVGGIFADNKEQLDFTSSEEMDLSDASVVCVSPEYVQLIEHRPGISKHCPSEYPLVGVQAHTFRQTNKFAYGASISNIQVTGFNPVPGCDQTRITGVRFGPTIQTTHFDYFSTVSNIIMDSDQDQIDLCEATNKGVRDIVITDMDGSLRPAGMSYTGTSSIVSNESWMTGLLDNCVPVPSKCYTYCSKACLRTLATTVSAADTENYKLKVCSFSDPSRCIEVPGIYDDEYTSGAWDPVKNSVSSKYRTFSASLPAGQFEAVFVNAAGTEVWPSFVQTRYEAEPQCSPSWSDGDIVIKQPLLAPGECNDIIQNGNAEADPAHHLHWLHRSGGIQVVPGVGVDGSHAFSDIDHTNDKSDAIAQYLDTRCLEVGTKYEIKAWLKLVSVATGNPYFCNTNDVSCPQAGLLLRTPDATGVNMVTVPKEPIAETTWHYAPGQFQLIHGIMTVTQEISDATSVLFYLERNKVGFEMYIDNVSITLHEPDADCGNLVYNGDFSSGVAEHWNDLYGGDLSVVIGADGATDYALSTVSGSPMQYIRSGCLVAGEMYETNLKYRLKDSAGQDIVCDTNCPVMAMRTTPPEGGDHEYRTIARVAGFPTAEGWSNMYGMFEANAMDANPNSQLRIYLSDNLADGTQVIIDSVSITQKHQECSGEITSNSDLTRGYLGYWRVFQSGVFSEYSGADGYGFRYSNRDATSHGPEYEARFWMDLRCITAGTVWEIMADVKLLQKGTADAGVSCDVSTTNTATACPSVRFYVYNQANTKKAVFKKRLSKAYAAPWDAHGFNRLRGFVTIPDTVTDTARVFLAIRDFNTNYDVVVKHFEIRKAAITDVPSASPTGAPSVAPSIAPSTISSLFPSSTPSVAPSRMPTTPTPTGYDNLCPPIGENLTLTFYDRPLVVSDDLCTLTKVTKDVVLDEVTGVVPIARSYSGNDWESASGEFAAEVFRQTSFDCISGICSIQLPPLEDATESYVLSSYAYKMDSSRDEHARMLEMCTFGTTKGDLDAWTFANDAQWVKHQMGLSPTSHRAYWRQRASPRWQFSQPVGRSNHPCDSNSRWRRYALTRKDRNKDDKYSGGYMYIVNTTFATNGGSNVPQGPYILTIDNHARTVVPDISWKDADLNNQYPYFDPNHGYQICANPTEYTGGRIYLKTLSGSCKEITRTLGNPPIAFTGHESHAQNVFSMTASHVLTVTDDYKDHGTTKNDDTYILQDGLSDPLCDLLPEQAEDYDAPVFALHPDKGWLQWDPYLRLEQNTPSAPLNDGGSAKEIATGGETFCSNVPRTFLNKDQCVLSTAESACGPVTSPDITLELNSTNIVQLHQLTGRYVYAITGLEVKSTHFSEEIDHPCTPNRRSRWEKTTGTCLNPTSLGTQTTLSLTELLADSKDSNPYVRDILFKSSLTCDASDTNVEIEIQVGADCWTHVHPEHLSVYDLTYWTLPNTHPGNKIAAEKGHDHPITKWLDQGNHILPYPSSHPSDPTRHHPMSRWDAHHLKFDYVGRFGDSVEYRDLPNELRLEQVADHYGAPPSPQGNMVAVCGSPGEVANDATKGGFFDLTSVTDRDTTSRFDLARQREVVWTMIALYSQDQLRQRMAWALSQILAIAKTSIPVHERNTEAFLQYYDILVRNAFGNYFDILREISYSPLMAENLSYLESKSAAYIYEKYGRTEFADENFAREIMQLFTTGLLLLNNDGTPKLDANNNTQQVYSNDDIRSLSRAWTGFGRQERRGNIEAYDKRNRIDPMRIEAEWRDKFPKSDLYGGFIGDGYPLCVDLPPKQFLRKGATYRLLGSSPRPTGMVDDSRLTKRFVIESGSNLYPRLCNMQGGSCQFPMEVTLDTNLVCHSLECDVDTVRVVQVAQGVFYEYMRPPCVEHPFFDNAMKLNRKKDSHEAICANPKLPVATSACCELPLDSYVDAVSDNLYEIERMTFATQDQRCINMGRASCEYDRVDRYNASHISYDVYHWAATACNIKVKVGPFGEVAIVHDMPVEGDKVFHMDIDNNNFFQVEWVNGNFPKTSDGDCGVCDRVEGNSCLCGTSVQETAVFDGSDPTSAGSILAAAHIGAPDPSSYDANTYTSQSLGDFTTHVRNGGTVAETIFEFSDSVGRTHFLKNSESTVHVDGGYSFRNPVHFMSFVPSEANVRDAMYETEATLKHLFYHDNTAPFLCVRFIQRFGISNPSPRYVATCSKAFRTGSYTSAGEKFGNDEYGNLEATVAAILLDMEARDSVLDVDPTQGSIREPVIRVMSMMRNLDFQPKAGAPMVIFDDLNKHIGQMAHECETVFAFFLSEFQPNGRVSSAALVSPEAQLLDMPKTIDLLNGLDSMVRYGLSDCDYGFGFNMPGSSGSCKDDGAFGKATGVLNYLPTGSTTEQIVDELCTLLTAGRLDYESRQAVVAAYDDALSQADAATALRTAQSMILMTPEFHTTNTVKFNGKPRPEPKVPIPAPGVAYKALVMVMFAGGCDSYNLLAPRDCTAPPGGVDAYTQYANIRTPVHLLQTDLLPIDGSGQVGCSQFGVHKAFPVLQQLYDEDRLVFFANTGVLGRPSTKDTFKQDTPTQLFSHNSMQRETKILDLFDEVAGTGVLGRLSDALSLQGLAVGTIAIDTTSIALVGKPGVKEDQLSVGKSGINQFMPTERKTMNKESMIKAIGDLNNATKADSGFMANTWSESLMSSLRENEALHTTLQGTTVSQDFGSGDLGQKLEVVSKLIKTRETRAKNIDIFYVQVGGFDHHSDVEERLANRFTSLNEGLRAFVAEMKSQSMWDAVTVVQASEFARTATANSGGGTDHAWGGNYFMFGGSMAGGKIHGQYPEDMSETGPLNLGRGRFLPTTSWDQIWPAVAQWCGVSSNAMLDMVCPNRDNFPTEFHRDDLFRTA